MRRALSAVLVVLAALAALAVVPAVWGQDIAPGYRERTPLPQTGLATYYAQGLMEYVRGYRQARGQLPDCPECVGSVALLRAGDIGRKVWLQPAGSEAVGPFLVVDCARREDVLPLIARRWAVDVSFELGRLWGMAGPLGGVTVLEDPADGALSARPGVPTRFFVPPGQVVISAPTAAPEVAAAAPTPWPTRQPIALHPGVAAAGAADQPPTAVARQPLTPVITTPTAAATPVAGGPAEQGPAAATPAPAPTATPAEIALGRPGAELLGVPAAPTAAWTWPAPTATARPPQRTPRPGLTPLLPEPVLEPTATPAPPESPLLRLWRILLALVLG